METERWPWLLTEPFKTRYAIAAYLVQNCPEVIEIGGYKTPFTDFAIGQHKRITVVSPTVIPNQRHIPGCQIEHRVCKFGEWMGKPEYEYGVVILGFEMDDMNDEAWSKLFSLINGSQITVIEVPVEHRKSLEQFSQLLPAVTKRVSLVVKMDLSCSFPADSEQQHYCRRNVYALT